MSSIEEPRANIQMLLPQEIQHSASWMILRSPLSFLKPATYVKDGDSHQPGREDQDNLEQSPIQLWTGSARNLMPAWNIGLKYLKKKHYRDSLKRDKRM